MKAFLVAISALFLLSSCKGSTEYGQCIGMIEDEKPDLIYRISVRNTVWSAIGFQLIFPPVLWITNYAKCPVSKK